MMLSDFAKEPSPRMGTAEGLLDETSLSYAKRPQRIHLALHTIEQGIVYWTGVVT